MSDQVLISRELLEQLLGFAESNLRDLDVRLQTAAIKAGKNHVQSIVNQARALLGTES